MGGGGGRGIEEGENSRKWGRGGGGGVIGRSSQVRKKEGGGSPAGSAGGWMQHPAHGQGCQAHPRSEHTGKQPMNAQISRTAHRCFAKKIDPQVKMFAKEAEGRVVRGEPAKEGKGGGGAGQESGVTGQVARPGPGGRRASEQPRPENSGQRDSGDRFRGVAGRFEPLPGLRGVGRDAGLLPVVWG